MVPAEIHRFVLGLDPPPRFRDWLYAHLDELERALHADEQLALLELDFEDPFAVLTLAQSLRARLLPLAPLSPAPDGSEGTLSIIRRDLDDVSSYLVLADELQLRGDPRGELITLQAGLLETGQYVLDEAEALRQHRAELLGALDTFVARGVLRLDWFMGFIARAALTGATSEEAAEIGRTLLQHPSGQLVRAIEARYAPEYRRGFEPLVKALGERRAWLTTLVLDTDDELMRSPLGDLAPVFEMQPHLRVVELNGFDPRLGPLPPEIELFVLRTPRLSSAAARRLAESSAPRLERLELWVGYGSDVHPEDLAPLLTRERLPRLRHLSLPCNPDTDELTELLLGSDLLPQLSHLDLSRGLASDVAGRILLEHAGALRHLECIDLRSSYLSEPMARALAGALPNVKVGDQGLPEDAYEWGVTMRRVDLRFDRWW